MTALAWLDRRFRAPGSPARLAAVRLLVGGFCVAYLCMRLPQLMQLTRLDARGWSPVGLGTVLGGAPPTGLAQALHVATLVLAIVFTLGAGYRVIAPLFAAALFFTTSYRSSWGMLYHSENLLLLHVAVLAVVPAADSWSVDAWRARRRGVASPPDDGVYAWPLRLMAMLAAVTYFLAGVAKLRGSGFAWIGDELLRHHVAYDAVRKAELGVRPSGLAPWALAQPWLWPPLAWGTMVIELGGVVAVAIGGRTARLWSLGVLGFHWGILALMGIPFHYPLSGVAVACLWPVERPLLALQAWVASRRGSSTPPA